MGQLKPMEDRMGKGELDRRAARKVARARVAAQLQGQVNLVGNYVSNFIRMPWYRRWLWVIIGERALR